MTTGSSSSSVGLDQMPTVSVFIKAKEAGWVVRVGTDVLAAGKWVSVEAAVAQDVHDRAKIREALKSLTGVVPKHLAQPLAAWPLPIASVAALISDLTTAVTEHAPAASEWWHAHGVELAEGEFPWLAAVSNVHVTTSTAREIGTLRALQGLGATGFLLGALTGRYPGSVVITCPDAGDRHQPKHGGTGRLQDYWPSSLRGVAAKAKAPLGRAAWTVGGDGAAAFVEAYGLTVPARVLSSPVVMPARSPAGIVDADHDVYVPAVPAPVALGRDGGVPATPAVEPPVGRSVTVPVDARAYLAALHAHVTQALGSTPTLVDVLRASAVAVVAVPTPTGVAQLPVPDLAHLLITRAKVAPALNVGDVRAAIDALNAA